ncbi:unnamed protein product [Allacma fusca]|uniref:Receptor ligand binding region domain-containing protein n=1 Tax=Allacma fusca TaxID=39272 RepID=A0A8J2M5S1_9HEXA|nr:unnamed protein product [Allacma fusca]
MDMKSGNWSRLSFSEALVFGFNIIDEKKFQDFQQRYAATVTGGLRGSTRVALTLDSVELLARGLVELDDTGTDLSNFTPASCVAERKWDIGEDLKDAFAAVAFDGITGPISFYNGIRSRVTVDILKLKFNNELGLPTFITVGNWSQGNLYGDIRDGIQMLDRTMLTNEKPEINKTLIITTIPGSSCTIKNEITVGRQQLSFYDKYFPHFQSL